MRAVLPLFLACCLACRPDDEIARAREPKQGAPPAEFAAAPRPDAPALRWTLPPGWKELPGSGLRAATLLPPGQGRLEATVIALPGELGGELANVNRWRGQLGLAPVDEAELAKARASLRSKAGPVALYDFTGGGAKPARIIAGILRAETKTWFVKLMGDAEAAATARPAFLRLLESLRASGGIRHDPA